MEITAENKITHDAEQRIGRSLWADAALRIWRDKLAMTCLAIILIYAVIAIVAPLALPDWENKYNYNNIYAGTSSEYWLGTDFFGRSIMEKTLLGAHTSMTLAFLANIIAVPLGMLLGAIAGYYGGRIDDLIVWLYTTLASIPSIILLIAIKFALKDKALFEDTRYEIELDGMVGMVFALSVTSWIGMCRLTRAETMKLREMDYILAARACGRGSFSIMLNHIIPNLLHIGIICFSLGFVGVIKAEVILSYLNLGVPNMQSWGRMIDSARMDIVVDRWYEVGAAVVAMFIIVLAWSIFGDRLRDALDPRLKNA